MDLRLILRHGLPLAHSIYKTLGILKMARISGGRMNNQGGFKYQRILAFLFGLAFSLSAYAFAADDDGMYDLESSVGHFSDYETTTYGSGQSFDFEKSQGKKMASSKTTVAQVQKQRDPKSDTIEVAQEEVVNELSRNEVAWHKGPAADSDPTPAPTEAEGFKIKLNKKK